MTCIFNVAVKGTEKIRCILKVISKLMIMKVTRPHNITLLDI